MNMVKYEDPWLYTAGDVEHAYHSLKEKEDLDVLMEAIGDSQFVLLGEASHGIHEFYTWRKVITQRLIEEKQFDFIAVEGDWPDCYAVNRYIKGYENAGANAREVLQRFERWPTWMWANWEIVALAEWLKKYNEMRDINNKIGFYGLDVYSLWESLEEIARYLAKEDPEAAKVARKAINCFEPYGEEGQFYAQAHMSLSKSCQQEVIALLKEIRNKAISYDGDREAVFSAQQNALVVANAEQYYRAMIDFGPESWNIRDRHMVKTLNALKDFYGENSKAIVWEHNTHIGDARATNMRDNGMVNVGQLVREAHEDKGVFLVGFGTYKGEVIAGSSWGAPMEVMKVPEARPGSLEHLLHQDSHENKLFFSKDELIQKTFAKTRGHRAIGVVYNPDREAGNYVPTRLTSRYDAFMFIDETKALNPLHIKPDGNQIPETYPFSF